MHDRFESEFGCLPEDIPNAGDILLEHFGTAEDRRRGMQNALATLECVAYTRRIRHVAYGELKGRAAIARKDALGLLGAPNEQSYFVACRSERPRTMGAEESGASSD